MANKQNIKHLTVAVVVVVLLLSSLITDVESSIVKNLFPDVEITLSNDGLYPIWYMCQMTDKADSLYKLSFNATYRFNFAQMAFPMRWCFLYINPRSDGFFWAYTVRSKCTKCFWSITEHPSLYRGDKGRWERQKLFMPSRFTVTEYLVNVTNENPTNKSRS